MFVCSLACAGLQSLSQVFGDSPLLNPAQRALDLAAELHRHEPRHVKEVLQLALSSPAVKGQGASKHRSWVTHVDSEVILMSLIEPKETLVSIVSRPLHAEFAVALLDGGTFISRAGQGNFEEPILGEASAAANVISTPSNWCHETDNLIVHLQQTGLGMPLQLRPRSAGGSCCDGLLDVLFGRSDVYLAPPARFTSEVTLPPAALVAFELILREAGGFFSDVYGQPLDVLAEADAPIYSDASAIPQLGLLACADCVGPYFARATAVAFPPFKSEFQQLTDAMHVRGDYDGPPLRLVD